MIDEIVLIIVCLSWVGLFIPALIERKRKDLKHWRPE
jgi:hypothetical protein